MSFQQIPIKRSQAFHWVDVCLLGILFLFIYAMIGVAIQWVGPFRSQVEIDLSYGTLPKYAFFSLTRGVIAYIFSLIFTIVYGYLAAHNKILEKILIPLLDILQSIPVLGFLPGLVLMMVSLFPESNFGLELAAVFNVFVGQVWNMTFSFYGSVRSVPPHLKEMTQLMKLSRWDVLKKVEVPFALNGLLWNSMLSMAGGWFFLTVIESFQLKGQSFRLPGIGSYMSVAIEQGHIGAMVAGVLTMILIIVLVDRCFWAPLVYLSSRYRWEKDEAPTPPLVIRILENSHLLKYAYAFGDQVTDLLSKVRLPKLPRLRVSLPPRHLFPMRLFKIILFAIGISGFTYGCFTFSHLVKDLSWAQWFIFAKQTLYTFLRVLVAIFLGSLWTIPVGVFIGMNPKWTRKLQPVVQVLAAFPAPMVFPVLTYIMLQAGISFTYGAALLMLVSSQWYILFNVISGASTIPQSFRDMKTIYKMSRFQYWRHILLPSIFPSLIGGWVTAAGGAWNASIVSEYVVSHQGTLIANGIGSAITVAANHDQFSLLVGSISVMVLFIIIFNRVVWQKLYQLADSRFKIEGSL